MGNKRIHALWRSGSWSQNSGATAGHGARQYTIDLTCIVLACCPDINSKGTLPGSSHVGLTSVSILDLSNGGPPVQASSLASAATILPNICNVHWCMLCLAKSDCRQHVSHEHACHSLIRYKPIRPMVIIFGHSACCFHVCHQCLCDVSCIHMLCQNSLMSAAYNGEMWA